MTTDLPPTVYDASPLLAIVFGEAGGEAVRGGLSGAFISTVNWSEVLQKCEERGVDPVESAQDLLDLGIRLVPFEQSDAVAAAGFWSSTQQFGLGLEDRACLALGARLSAKVATMDRAWSQVSVGVDIWVVPR